MIKRLPTINQYIESIVNHYSLFRTLEEFEYEIGNDQEPMFISGNNSIIFKIIQDHRPLMLKCYLKQAHHTKQIYHFVDTLRSPYIVRAKWLHEEMYVYDHCDCGAYYDVVVAPWIEGRTLESVMNRAAICGDVEALRHLSANFDAMALYLLRQPWAHGDMKPDNIIVTGDNMDFKLIDYDAMFTEELAGQRTAEIGTSTYQHPLRDSNMYDRNIDDYPLALISMMLHAMALQPSIHKMYKEYEKGGTPSIDILQGKSRAYDLSRQLFINHGQHALVALIDTLRSPTPHIEALERIIGNIQHPKQEYTPINTIITPFDTGVKWGYVNQAGRMIIEAIYNSACMFCEEVAVVNLDGSWQYIDKHGVMVLSNARWSSIKSFGNGVAAVKVDSKWGYIDHTGNMVINAQFEIAATMHEGVAVVKKDGKYGYIYPDGQWAISPQFDYATSYNNGVAMVEIDGKMVEIDKSGNQLFDSMKND